MQSLSTRATCARILCAPALARPGGPAGRRFVSSSAGVASRAGLKAFPVFRNSRGVIECNELFLHPLTGGPAPAATRHPDADEPSAASLKAAKLAALYSDLVATRELESPILLQGVATPAQRAGFAGTRGSANEAKQDVQTLS